MAAKYFIPFGVFVALAGCDENLVYLGTPSVPEGVAEIAAPGQDLSRAFLKETDNCYWYLHAGPVETTELPLRTNEGRPICVTTAAPA